MSTFAVVHQLDRSVTFHDLLSSEPLATVELASISGQPHEARFDAERGVIYVSHPYRDGWYAGNSGRTSTISVIDTASRELVDTIDLGPEVGPHDLWVDHHRDLLWVSVERSDHADGGLAVVDPNTRRVIDRVGVEAYGTHWFTATPDGATLYTANKETPFVAVVDARERRFVGRVDVPGSEGICATPDGRHVLVAAPAQLPGAPEAPPGLRVIDTASNTVVRTLTTEHPLAGVHVTSAGIVLAAHTRRDERRDGNPRTAEGTLLFYAAETFEQLAEIPTGAMGLTITSSPDGALAYVANMASDSVSVVDVEQRSIRHTVKGIGGAHGVVHLSD
jgi:YVTN family beta-propeller protein